MNSESGLEGSTADSEKSSFSSAADRRRKRKPATTSAPMYRDSQPVERMVSVGTLHFLSADYQTCFKVSERRRAARASRRKAIFLAPVAYARARRGMSASDNLPELRSSMCEYRTRRGL